MKFSKAFSLATALFSTILALDTSGNPRIIIAVLAGLSLVMGLCLNSEEDRNAKP